MWGIVLVSIVYIRKFEKSAGEVKRYTRAVRIFNGRWCVVETGLETVL
jgi:hypothetical protein